MDTKNDFSKGSISANILKMALPMTVAQLVNVLYNIVDRMYIGHMAEGDSLAITGLGLTFPIITIISAFANLFGIGGAQLCSIARGKKEDHRAEQILGNSFYLLLTSGIVLSILCMIFKRPILYLFGASDATFPYADAYLQIYLCGSVFVMLGLGLNSFINAQGFGVIGLYTVLLGTVTNIILDPIFIFGLDLGVRGAALATVISQFLSCVWVMLFLTGKKAVYRIKRSCMKLDRTIVSDIVSLGLTGFIMAITNSGVQIVCNATLSHYGGDVYVGVMTVLNSIREIIIMPVHGMTNGAQPVIGFNYGAGEALRVKKGIKFMSVSCILYTFAAWGILMINPAFFIRIFNNNAELVTKGIPALNLYFFGFFMMSLQFAGQSTFVALGKAKYSIFFSLLRKAIIVIPLTLLLPKMFGLSVLGVFLAEPVSNFIGGTACYATMYAKVYLNLGKKQV